MYLEREVFNMLNNYDMKYIIRKVIIFFIIFFIFSCFKVAKAETISPYMVIKSNNPLQTNQYIYYEGRKFPSRLPEYGITDYSNHQQYFCITPFSRNVSLEVADIPAYYAEISVCTTGYKGRNGWWQASGSDYATFLGFIDYSDRSCVTNDGFTGYIQKVYVQLIDWTTPSGGADFSWTCFTMAQDNYGSGYYNISKIMDIKLNTSNTFESDKQAQLVIEKQQQIIDSQNANAQQAHSDAQNTQSAINQNTQAQNQTNGILNDDNVSGANAEVDSLLQNSAFQDTSGIQSIITAPLNFIQGLTNTCSPISLTIPYINSNVTIPCMKQELTNRVPTVVPVLSTVINGFVIYRILLDIVSIIKNSRDPEDDRIEVLDL